MLQLTTANGLKDKKIVSRQEWLEARIALLKEEKELTRKSDELARKRVELPWVLIDKEYSFDGDDGKLSLPDLFNGRSQLLVYHFMFGPDYTAGCPSCSSISDEFDAIATHLKNHDVMLAVVSRAPLEKLQAYKKRMGWHFPWVSSFNSDFNFDFGVSFTEQQQEEGIDYNYQKEKPVHLLKEDVIIPSKNTSDGTAVGAFNTGTDMNTYARERPGMSAFALEGENVYHSYSAFTRGLDVLWNMYQWLDRTPKGRNENSYWLKRHDEYGNEAGNKPACCCS